MPCIESPTITVPFGHFRVGYKFLQLQQIFALSLLHHADAVRIANSGESMGDHPKKPIKIMSQDAPKRDRPLSL
jgi:hypothetical protein